MKHKPDDNRQSNLHNHATGILACLILLCLTLVLSACNSATELPTHTPTATRTTIPTQTLTPRPSVAFVSPQSPTISFTETATIEPTWTPQPTNMTLIPTPAAGLNYRLTDWTPEKAEQLIDGLKNYPDTLTQRGYKDSLYNFSFRYGGLAELESALRFPNSDQGKKWQWDGAYSLYRSGNKDIGSLYAGFIAKALNKKETDLANLKTWVDETISFSLDTYEITPPQGFEKSLILHIYNRKNGVSFAGFTIWLLKKEGVFSGYSLPLPDVWAIANSDNTTRVDVIDITGDGIAEVIVQNANWQSFGQHDGDLKIFRLDQVPPREIAFDTPLPDPEIAEWSVNQRQPAPTITFKISVSTSSSFSCYPFKVDWQYQWQQDQLKFIEIVPPSIEEMEQDPTCTRLLVYKLGKPIYLKNLSALKFYKSLLELPFIEKDTAPEFSFSLEKERLSLALFLEDQGDLAGAKYQIERIRADTDPSLIEWRENAIKYFAVHRDPKALFQFCLSTRKCETFLNRSDIFTLIPTNHFLEAEAVLQQMGISVHDSGSYDFDQDGKQEKWLFFLSEYICGSGTEFWILANGENEIYSRLAAMPCLHEEDNERVEIQALPSSGILPSYQITIGGEDRLYFPFLYWRLAQEDPTIDFIQAWQMIDAVQNRILLNQATLTDTQKQLTDIQNLPLEPSNWSSDIQGQTLYLLGLAQELNEENSQAAQTYLELWQTYPDTPYALMAYAKLEPVP